MYFRVKGFFLCFSGCISNSDSGDDCTEMQTLKFCEPSQGKLSNAKAGITFQVYKVNSAKTSAPLPLVNASQSLGPWCICVYIL